MENCWLFQTTGAGHNSTRLKTVDRSQSLNNVTSGLWTIRPEREPGREVEAATKHLPVGIPVLPSACLPTGQPRVWELFPSGNRMSQQSQSGDGVWEGSWSHSSSVSVQKQVLTRVREGLSKRDQLASNGESKQTESKSLPLPSPFMWAATRRCRPTSNGPSKKIPHRHAQRLGF